MGWGCCWWWVGESGGVSGVLVRGGVGGGLGGGAKGGWCAG